MVNAQEDLRNNKSIESRLTLIKVSSSMFGPHLTGLWPVQGERPRGERLDDHQIEAYGPSLNSVAWYCRHLPSPIACRRPGVAHLLTHLNL